MRLLKTALPAGLLLIISTWAPTNATAQEAKVNTTVVNPAGLYDPAPNGYSHAIVAEGVTRIAYIAGQGGENQTGALAPKFADQVKQAYANLRTVLNAVGAKPHQVTKITTYVVDYDQSMLNVMTRHVKEMFGDYDREGAGVQRLRQTEDLAQLFGNIRSARSVTGSSTGSTRGWCEPSRATRAHRMLLQSDRCSKGGSPSAYDPTTTTRACMTRSLIGLRQRLGTRRSISCCAEDAGTSP